LGKRKLGARFVFHRLTPEQGIFGMNDADKNIFNKLFNGDETWCYAYDL